MVIFSVEEEKVFVASFGIFIEDGEKELTPEPFVNATVFHPVARVNTHLKSGQEEYSVA